MNYSKSPSSHMRGSPYGKQLPDGPIHDLSAVVEKTTPEDWKKRTQALAHLVASIPDGSEYVSGEAWYSSPPVLRHLAWPLAELLKDPRSTVIMRTCESCVELFGKCQYDARYLLMDLMPTILGCHAQTVQVIRTTVQDMMINILGVTPCKMVMPVWLDRLKSDKARSVREACALYLGVALQEWTEVGYLSLQIWEQVGTALTKALRDPSPEVRQQAKRGLETINRQQPDIFDRLVENSDLVRDTRVQKILGRIQAGEAVADDVSVASSRAGSVGSRRRAGGSRSITPRGPTNRTGPGGPSSNQSAMESKSLSNTAAPIPKTIGVTNGSAARKGGGGGGLGPPIRVSSGPFHAVVTTPPPSNQRKEQDERPVVSTNDVVTTPSGDPAPLPGAANTSFDSADTHESDLPVIASADELREYAKSSRGSSQRSSLLQERFARSHTQSSDQIGSTMDLDEILNQEGEVENGKPETNVDTTTNVASSENDDSPPAVITLPEHARIAQAILEAHKKHVDLIMETLKVEMDALKEFELTMLEEGPTRPTEDEVLEYFESVGLCVEQRAKAGTMLQKKMDKISKGLM